ncbi:30S ribosomal protein S21 [Ureaplasma sp. ES3154-GEN]|uniref:30S ribosomal protein S21 n=1 Tax=Ureaplasma sp. ES3154-GEN TaxID=2984844 RepID=UPI0021E6E38E|nr:30S ribosomal protein S21 [Ureaplasma sp. ES3154-GEN]MCV3743693.1 30S ribosomal protein S21 [Ureaplasma sp. ES3154-GEN]
MSRGVSVEGDLEKALKKFKRISNETKKDSKRHEYHLRPGLRKKEKIKEANKYRSKY